MPTASGAPSVASPTALSVTAGEGQITLSWTAATGSGVARTLIYQGTSSSSLSLVDSTSSGSATSKTITGLNNSTLYYFTVRTRGNDNSLSAAATTVSATPAYEGPVWWVATNGSSSNAGSVNSPFSTIQDAYNAAAAGDTIKLKPGTYTGAGNRNITIAKNIVITSRGGADSTSLDLQNNNYRHFTIGTTATLDTGVVFIGLTFKNSNYSYTGGSIYLYNSSPRFKNCVFENNKAYSSYGGAIHIKDNNDTHLTSPVFQNCTFKDNSAKSHAGAIYIEGYEGTPVFRGCTFTGNNSLSTYSQYTSNYGGAVYLLSRDTTFTASFADCVFDSNKAESGYYSGYGGAVYAQSYNEDTRPATFVRSYFRGNTAKGRQNGYGGALNMDIGFELVNCSITGNTATTSSTSSYYYGRGGAIYIDTYQRYNSSGSPSYYLGGDSKIINCTIAGNTASSTYSSSDWGGGIYANALASTEFTMFNTIIWGNTSDNYESIYRSSTNMTLTFDYNNIADYDYTLASNSTASDPGFTNASNNDYTLSSSSYLLGVGAATYDGNAAPSNDIASSARPNPSGSSPDLGAHESSLSGSPNPGQVQSLSAAARDGGAVLSWTANTDSDMASYKIYKSTTSGFTPSSSTLLATVSHPTATYTATGLTNGTTYYFSLSAIDTDGNAGLYSTQVSVVPNYAGPVWWVATNGSSSNVGSSSSPFSTLSSAYSAAADGDTITFKDGTFTGSGNRNITFSSSKNVVINSLNGAASSILDAGAASRHFTFNSGVDSTFEVIGLTLKNGNNYQGGSIYINSASPKFKNCTIRDNTASASATVYGGAIYITGTSSSPTFSNCQIVSNTAETTGSGSNSASGGAIYVISGSPVFTDCQINYNTTSARYYGMGGAVYLAQSDHRNTDPVTFRRCQFIGNSNTSTYNGYVYGGGLGIQREAVLSGCLIAGNTGSSAARHAYGGGIHVDLASFGNEVGEVLIVNSTIVGNSIFAPSSYTSYGGGINIIANEDVIMFNSIVWDNTAESSDNMRVSGSSLTSNYNNVEGGTGQSWFGNNSLNIDPRFTDASAGNYTLSLYSTLLGAGTASFDSKSAPAKDISGTVRPNPSNSTIDMGAYESTLGTSPVPVAPIGLAATAGNGQVVLTWTAHTDTDVSKYGIYYGTSSGPTVKQADVSGRTTVTTTLTNLSNNVAYYFRITAIDDNYESAYSTEVSATPSFDGTTIYVDNSPSSAPSNPDGSEDNAYYTIQAALENSNTTNGMQILVKAGTYTGHGDHPVVEFNGKNVVIESVAGPATTIIDGQGSRTAISMNYNDGGYGSGYTNSTKIIGFTIKNGDEEYPLVDIEGPSYSSSSSNRVPWNPVFENCRFMNSTVAHSVSSWQQDRTVITIYRASPTFDGCTFRGLKRTNDGGSTSSGVNFYAPIRMKGNEGMSWNNSGQFYAPYDSVVYRPKFKNCVIAGNSNELDSETTNTGFAFYGGAVSIGTNAAAYFENTRIDSNKIEAGGDYQGTAPDLYTGSSNQSNSYGGAVHIHQGPKNNPAVLFVNSSISYNTNNGTNIYGGAVYTRFGQTWFINSVLVQNEANSKYKNSASSNSNTYNNAYGGAVYYDLWNSFGDNSNYTSKDAEIRIVNSTIADNEVNPTSNNSSYAGAGLYRYTSSYDAVIFNSIIYGNTTATGTVTPSKINMSTSNSAWGTTDSEVDYSLIQYASEAGVDEDNTLSTDPKFSAGATVYTLSAASPAIGAGTSTFESITTPAYDYLNTGRPVPTGSSPDLGAFENSLSTTPYPDSPSGLTVSSVNDSTVTLSWTAGTETDLVRYRIYTGTSANASTLVDSVGASFTSKSVGGLTNGTTYYFAIVVVDGDGYVSGNSNVVSGTPEYKGPVWYVDDDATNANGDGSSGLPFREIDDGIEAASTGDTVMVLPGTYDRAGDQELSFIIYNNTQNSYTVKNIVLMSRDGAATTILDGESSRVFQMQYQSINQNNTTTVLVNDTSLQIIGFTIKGSNGGDESSDGSLIKIQGGSVYEGYVDGQYVYTYYNNGVTFKNCIIADTDSDAGSNNNISGLLNLQYADARFIDCIIRDNSVTSNYSYGTIRLASKSSLYMNRCKIVRNTIISEGGRVTGGAISTNPSDHTVKIINCVIADNKAKSETTWGMVEGGGICFEGNGHYTVINSTITGNIVESDATSGNYEVGSGIIAYNNSGNEAQKLTIFNSIIYGNIGGENSYVSPSNGSDQFYINASNIEYTVSHSILADVDEDEFDFGDGILDVNPQFADTNYTLSSASMAIGAGTASLEDSDNNNVYAPTVDYAGNVRPNPAGSNPDMGARENSLAVTPYPDAPTNIAGTAAHRSVSLTWSAPSADDVSKYYVFQADSSSNGWSSFASADTLTGLTSTSTTITGLTNGTKYAFYVTAIDTANYQSSASGQVKLSPFYNGPVWYVDDGSGAGIHEGSPDDPFREVQDAIDVASAGDTVIVLPGTYDRPDDQELDFITSNSNGNNTGKNIVLMSRDGAAATFLDGENKVVFDISGNTDTTLHIIGFTITASNGGEDDGSGAVVNIHGSSFWNNTTQQNESVSSGATFKHCVFTMSDSDEDWSEVAVDIKESNVVFDNCEFTNISVDYTNYQHGDGFSAAIRAGSPYGSGSQAGSTVILRRSKITNNKIQRTDVGYIHAGAIMVGPSSFNNVKLINTIVADNEVYYSNDGNSGHPTSGGAIKSRGGHLQLINSSIVNNELKTDENYTGGGSAINVEDWSNDGYQPYVTMLNSIIYGNVTTTSGGSNFQDQIMINDYSDGAEAYFSYSVIQGDDDFGGDEILHAEPGFLDSTYALHPRSAAIGQGSAEGEDALGNIINAPQIDYAGNVRPNPVGSNPDIGAWENNLAVSPYPDSPTGLFATEDNQSVLLLWSTPDARDVVQYRIYSSSDSTNFTLVDSTAGLYSTEGTVTGLTNNQRYWFYVTSVDTAGYESSPSLQIVATPSYLGPVWYVDANSSSGSHEGSATDAFREIQDAIDAADEGDTVMVLPGTYARNDDQELKFAVENQTNGTITPKNIVLFARDGPDLTILDGEGNKQLFIIDTQNDTTLKIVGFTIQNGGGDLYEGAAITVSGVYVSNTNGTDNYNPSGAVFENCVIKDADSEHSPAILVTNGGAAIFRDCLIKNNRNYTNGGQVDGAGIKVHQQGIVLLDRTKVMENYTDNNGAGSENHRGPGVHAENSTIYVINSLIAGNYSIENHQNSANYGSGLYAWNSEVVIINSTITDNQGIDNPGSGSGTAVDIGGDNVRQIVIFNSIIAGNYPSYMPTYIQQNSGQYVAISNSIFESGSNEWFYDSDAYCYDFDPMFTDSLGTLSAYSLAIGKGGVSIEDVDENDVLNPGIDLYGNPRPNPAGSNPDIGAYEHVLSEPRRLVYYVDDSNGNNNNDGLTIATALKTIAEGLNKSSNRDTLELVAGTYDGVNNRNLNMQGMTRIIRSTAGAATTIIDCQNLGPAFVFNNDENDSVHISGLTIINGSASNGGAVSITGADPVFENMIFRDNSGTGNGGAIYLNDSESSFTNCVFDGNHSADGGAIYMDGGAALMDHCTFINNTSDDTTGVSIASGTLEILNSIYWGNHDIDENASVAFSNVMGGFDGEGNMNGRPGFTDAENGNVTLLDWSPMIGSARSFNAVEADIAGVARPDTANPDMGAYENSLHAPSAYTSVTWHVETTGTDEVIYSNPSTSTGSFESIDWVMDHVLEGDSVIVHPGYYDNGFSNWGKSAHIRGSSSKPDDVWISEEMEFNGGSSSLHMLSIHNDAGDGVVVSAGSIDISYVLIDSVSGEAIALSDTADATISNVTLYGNGHALVDSSTGSVSVVNTIIWGNTNAVAGDPTITYSNVQGGYTGAGNVNVDPLFTNASEKDFELNILSPCIDAGDTSSTYDADNTVVDMGAFPRQRVLLSGDSQGDITVSADTVVIITDDFTVSEDDTLALDAGAELFFGSGVSLTVSGALDADGDADGGAISFLPTHPDSTWGGLTITGAADDGHRSGDTYSYIQISGVEASSIPLTVDGSATLNHVTIAGNANAVSLSTTGTVDLNYSILEGQVDGTVNSVGSFTSSTDQFSDYANDDFTLLAAAAGIDIDTAKVDPDYTYGDAGAFYHDQSSYPVTSITVLLPATGDTLLASPDTSTTVGLTSNIQLFNTYGRYKTKGSVTWASVNNTGSFSVVSTDSTDLNGMVSNQYVTSTVTGSYNSFTVSADDASATSGFYLVEPGEPDSVVIAVQSGTMTQLDSLTFTANIYDQFSNLVRLGEDVVWSIASVSGSGDGYRLSSDTTETDAAGNTTVMLYTDPTDNTLSVGDQVTVTANSGSGSHVSSVVIIIPSDIYNLTLDEGLTTEELGVSADTAFIDFYTALVDTFDNPLENVEVLWEVVIGSGTGESLSAGTSNTNAQGVASTRLNTNTVSGTEYQVRCWVTESSLLNAFGSFESLANNGSSATTATNSSSSLSAIRSVSHSIKQGVSSKSSSFVRSKEIEVRRPGQFVPAQIDFSSSIERNINRVAAYDLDDTSAVVLVWPGVTASLSNVPQNSEDLELDDQFGFTLDAQDQFGNLVRDNTSVTWQVIPSSANVSVVSQDDVTSSGQASIALEVESYAAWDFSFKIVAIVEGISDTTGSYRIDDVTAPAAVSGLSISPSAWTSNNDFTLTWTNPSEHSGVAGAHYKIDGESSEYVAGADIQTLSISLPANDSRTVKLWLRDNADNDDESTAMVVTAKWDDTSPSTFDLTKPLAGWYNTTEYRFEWEASSDATSGLSHYLFSINGGNETAEISPDSTGFSPLFGLAQGSHSWTVTAYDSAGNAMETSNPQTINVDHTAPGITHNPVVEATENTAVVINAVFTEDGAGQSGIYKADLYYRRGGEANWQPPVDMSTLSSYQIASSYSTSSGIEYYLYAEDVAGNITNKPVADFTSISVTIPNGLASTDRWPTGVPNGSDVSSYQLWSFPGNPTSSSPVNLIVDDMPEGAFDNTKWRAFAYAGSGGWTEFEQLSSLNSGESYFILIKDPGFSINTGQTYTVTTNQPYQINLTSGDWTFIGNPFDFSIPLSSVLTEDSTSLSGDQNFYTYDGGSWTNASSIEPWGGYIYKSSSASKIFIDPGSGSGGLLGRNAADSEIMLEEDEWLINIAARNGLGRDKFNEVGLLQGAMDTYDNQDAFEPPLVPGGVSVRINNRDWPEHGDTYTRDIRMPKEEGEYWNLEVIAQDDEHNVYLTFEDLDLIPEDLDVFAIDVTLGIAQDLRWRHVYKYAVTDPSQKHEVRFIVGTREFLQKNNAGIELFPDRYALSQNYPNPFNPQTSILLTMQDEANVSLVVYNLLGEEVAVLVNNEYRPAGYHNFIWKGLNKDNERVASGVYFYMARVISPKGELLISDTHKMILVK